LGNSKEIDGNNKEAMKKQFNKKRQNLQELKEVDNV